MCVICVSKKGVRQPNADEIRNMWESNPHGAGYMFVKNGKVEIHKGFMCLKDFMRSVNGENFTKDDVVVYHFRISTQAGVNPAMTHPFPMSDDLEDMKILDGRCDVGIVHNGIIKLTSCNDDTYSDTALFIANYLPALLRTTDDVTDKNVLRCVKALIGSKMVFLSKTGDLGIIGDFIADKSGLMFSNSSFQPKNFGRSWTLQDLYGYRNSRVAM